MFLKVPQSVETAIHTTATKFLQIEAGKATDRSLGEAGEVDHLMTQEVAEQRRKGDRIVRVLGTALRMGCRCSGGSLEAVVIPSGDEGLERRQYSGVGQHGEILDIFWKESLQGLLMGQSTALGRNQVTPLVFVPRVC